MFYTICLLGILIGTSDDVPQFKRQLSPAASKRAAELEKEIEDSDITDSGIKRIQEKASELFQLLKKELGESHWRTVNARVNQEITESMLKMPVAQRFQMASIYQAGEEATGFSQKGFRTEAIKAYRKAVDLSSKLFGQQHLNTARLRNNLAIELLDDHQLAEAKSAFQESMQVFQRQLSPKHPEVGTCYNNLSLVHRELAEYEKAIETAEKAYAITYDAYGETSDETALTLNTYANALTDVGRFAEAESNLNRAIAIRKRLLPPDDPKIASVLSNLGNVFYHEGRLVESRSCMLKSLEIYKKHYPDFDDRIVTIYGDLATCLNGQGFHDEALELQKKTLAIRLVLKPDSPEVARSMDAIATNYAMLGQVPEAYEIGKKALELRKKLYPAHHTDVLMSQINLVPDLMRLEKYPEAEKLINETLAVCRDKYQPVHQLTAMALYNHGEYCLIHGQLETARISFKESYEILRKLFGDKHQLTIRSLIGQGMAFMGQEKYAEAEKAFREAVVGHEALRSLIGLQGLDRAYQSGQTTPIYPLVLSLIKQGKATEACAVLETALSRGLSDEIANRKQQLLSADERKQLQVIIQELRQTETEFARLQTSSGNDQGKRDTLRQKQIALESRYLELEQSLLAKYGVTEFHPKSLEAIQAQLQPDQALLCWIDYRMPPGRSKSYGEHWACVVRKQGEPFWIDLASSRSNGAWTKSDSSLPDRVFHVLNDIIATTKRDTISDQPFVGLLQELVHQRMTPLASTLAASGTLPQVRHLIVLPSSMMLNIPVSMIAPEYVVSYTPSGTFWANQHLERTTPNNRRLLLVADPVFSTSPSQAKEQVPEKGVYIAQIIPKTPAELLQLQAGDVLLTYDQSSVNSKVELIDAIKKSKPNTTIELGFWRAGKNITRKVPSGDAALKGMLLNPQPPREAARADEVLTRLTGGRPANDGRWKELRFAKQEADYLQIIFQDNHAHVTALRRENAIASNLRNLASQQDLAGYSHLHFATHGISYPQRAFASSIVLSTPTIQQDSSLPSPGGGTDDGQITAMEIRQTWRLNADLVTLSACETGQGRSSGGEGLLGFPQTLLLAGARSVVVSQWKVDDLATTLLMGRFYRNLFGDSKQAPLPKAQALAEAQRWLRTLTIEDVKAMTKDRVSKDIVKNYLRSKDQPALPSVSGKDSSQKSTDEKNSHPFEHPRFWAAFVLIGKA